MRTELEHRPLFVAAICLTLGLAIPHAWPLLIFWIGLFLWLRPGSLKLWVAASGFVGVLMSPPLLSSGITDPQYVDATGRLAILNHVRDDKQSGVFDFGSLRLFVTFPKALDLDLGDQVHARGIAEPLSEGMDSWALTEGVVGQIHFEDDQITLVEHAPWIYHLAQSWRKSLTHEADRELDAQDAALVKAVCFGRSEDVSDERYSALKNLGTVHLVTASGLHVLLLGGALLALLGFLPIPRAASLCLLVALLFLYVAATDFHLGTIRASIMTILGAAAYLFRRESDLLTSAGLAAIVILLGAPGQIFNLGFYLTFIVILGIALFASPRFKSQPLASSLRTGLIAMAAMAPMTVVAFGYFSIVSVFANLVCLVAMVPLLALGLLASVMQFVSTDAAGLLLRAAGVCARILGSMLDTFGSQSWATVSTPHVCAWWLIPIYGLPLLLWRKRLREA